ncbi:cobalamin-binding protein [Candidatus Palauibacter polyketidifaciens]|uniref:cobalamin-binding protein n=1 Tax=Candidatus Palauibacter polyketidifaciens TaxID=3056740 RepID=UPI00139E968B|nr:cobalamin-binding protein [Candidatus Palauibacter polyketidifaciens]MDE2719944.1 cobalamin-binding protein [Candidatus Palauibacter polyketidifaciens]MYE34968.1 cobalamin-binding protein [Gemmatimonadales bacterium]
MTPAAPRIVSLLASGTEIVDALGLGECLVGISHECDHPPHLLDRPRVSRPRFDPEALSSGEIDAAVRQAMTEHGSVYEVDAAVLEKLDPDIIITQAVCDVCAVPTDGVREVLGARGIEADVVSLDAHTIEDILASITQVARAAGSPEIAGDAGGSLRRRLDAVRAAVPHADPPRVLGIEWFDPPFAPGHWVPEMIELAGGRNLAGEAGQPSREVSWDEIRGLDPDALLLMPCGYGLDASRADADAHAERLGEVAPRAIAEGRAWVVDASSYFNRSGPRFVTGVEILGGLLHPDRVPTPDAEVAAVWTPPA